MHAPGDCRMQLCIDEAWHHRLAGEVDLLRPAACEREDLVVAADGQESSIGYRNRLRERVTIIDRDDVAIVKNQVTRGALKEERGRDGKRAETAEKFALGLQSNQACACSNSA